MKKLFLKAEFGPLWEPWKVDETPRKILFLKKLVHSIHILFFQDAVFLYFYSENLPIKKALDVL